MVENATVDVLINIPNPRAIKLHSSGDMYCSVRFNQVSMFKQENYGK